MSETDTRLLRAILSLLIVMARWMFDFPGQNYRTQVTWCGLRDGITEAEMELKGEPEP